MSHAPEHPDDLLARARTGSLNALERQRLDAHLRRCQECSFEQSVARDLYDDAGAADPAWIARMTDAVTEQALADRARRVAWSRRPTVWLVAAAVALVALTAAAAVVVIPRTRRHTESPAPRAQAPRAQTTSHAVVRHEAPASAPTVEAPVQVERPARAPAVSAAELYRRANESRHARDDREAERLYGDLIGRHPASREALQARMSLGRLLLDRREDPARAARLFQDYLRRAPGAPDEEAALAGLARANQALGRRDDEQAAWERLLAGHPDSVHAETARRRVEALR